MESVLAGGTTLDYNLLIIELGDDTAHRGTHNLRSNQFIREHLNFDKEVAHIDIVVDGSKLCSRLTRWEHTFSNHENINGAVLHEVEEDRVLYLCDIAQNLGELLSHELIVIASIREVKLV